MAEEYPENYPASACEEIDLLEEQLEEAMRLLCLVVSSKNYPVGYTLENEIKEYINKYTL